MAGRLLVALLLTWTSLASARTDLTRFCKFFYTNNDTDNRNLEKIDDAFGPGCIGNGGNLISLFPCTVDVDTGEFSCPPGIDGQRRGEWAENTIEPVAPADPGQCFFYFMAEQFCIKCFGETVGRCLSGVIVGPTTTSTTVVTSTTTTSTTTSSTTTTLASGASQVTTFSAGTGASLPTGLPTTTTTTLATTTTTTTLPAGASQLGTFNAGTGSALPSVSQAADWGAGSGSLP